MSEISSVSTNTTFNEIAVCEEIGQLIERCEELEQEIDNSFQTLQNIQSLVKNSNNIRVTYNGSIIDLYEVFETIHTDILEDIKKGNSTNFGEKILKEVETMVFHKN